MTYEHLISLCNPDSVYGPEPNTIGALRQDSRKVEDGDVFIAVQGFNVDGHSYIEDAISRGASAIICEKTVDTEKQSCFIQVGNTRTLVGPLAQAFEGNPADQMSVVGITGTNGKTTVATLVYQILKQLGAQPALLGTVAKRIGDEEIESRLTTSDPIELAADMRKMVAAGSTHLVMEVSSHALDQERVNGIDFEVAAFTNLSHDHLDYHKEFKSYAASKKKLFDGLEPEAHAVINGDDDQASFITMDCKARIIDFSFRQALKVECQVLSNSIEGLVIRIGKTMIESPLIGLFNAYNITEAFLIGHALGYSRESLKKSLESAHGAPGRLERIEGSGEHGNPIVLVDYAHTPDALENVTGTLAELKKEGQELHLIFGCGGNRDKTKRPRMAQIAERFADRITVTSDNPRDEEPERIIDDIMEGFEYSETIERLSNREKAIAKAIYDGDPDTIILIAGKGHETYQEIKGERYDFDDRKIARESLAHRNPNQNQGDS